MKTLNENYEKNIAILEENIKRGMSYGEIITVIRNMEDEFKRAGLFGKEEKTFLLKMREVAINHFTTKHFIKTN